MVIISVFTTLALQHIENNSKENIHASLQTVLITTQEALHLWLREQLEEIDFEINRPKTIELTERVLNNAAELENKIALNKLTKLMNDRVKVNNYKGFTIISPKRKIIAASKIYQIGTTSIIQQQRKEYLNRVFSGETLFIPTIISDVPVLSQSGRKVTNLTSVYIASPIINNQGRIIAVMVFALNPQTNFTRIMKLGRIGETGETYAFDKSARLITDIRFNAQLKSDGELSRDDEAVMTIKITDPGVNLVKHPGTGIAKELRPLTLMATKAISNNSAPYIESYRDYRGVQVFGVWLWDKVLDIGITTEIDKSEAILPHVETRKTIYVILFFVILLSFGLIILFIKNKENEKQIVIAHKEHLEELVSQRTQELEKTNLELKRISEIDPLTQIANRRAYDKALELKISDVYRTTRPLSLLMIDIDLFKLFNDNYGHDAGDEVLFLVAQTIAEALPRNTDMVARYGGEEFTVLLAATDSKGAVSVAERIRLNIELKSIEHQYSTIADILTVSIGCTTLTEKENKLTAHAFFKQADQALYLAKNQGRNRCVVYQDQLKDS